MPIDLIVKKPDLAVWNGRDIRCATGRGGFVAVADKVESDGATPLGRWIMREVLYRADRLSAPVTALPVRAIQPDDAWCDVVGDPLYNHYVKLPYASKDEHLWREDHVYNLIVVLGFNDDPVVDGKGSAIFLHVARPDFRATAGCVALLLYDLLDVLREAEPGSAVTVLNPSQTI